MYSVITIHVTVFMMLMFLRCCCRPDSAGGLGVLGAMALARRGGAVVQRLPQQELSVGRILGFTLLYASIPAII
jgi:hypothetical protein